MSAVFVFYRKVCMIGDAQGTNVEKQHGNKNIQTLSI